MSGPCRFLNQWKVANRDCVALLHYTETNYISFITNFGFNSLHSLRISPHLQSRDSAFAISRVLALSSEAFLKGWSDLICAIGSQVPFFAWAVVDLRSFSFEPPGLCYSGLDPCSFPTGGIKCEWRKCLVFAHSIIDSYWFNHSPGCCLVLDRIMIRALSIDRDQTWSKIPASRVQLL